ncbi:MAG: hypothetical protein COU90_03550 [Candidatus Ryanbacteria bacterium CG10_big_fil_rev_8_21_14_0_10_43_42]|uniref:DUF2268 domain-containing protein n=1 Tax=Candidatus Ryanbacteria bacterium CG10_big_fil_rev_8_21_14_0_10_43_42 TaxID=1974864 RepID=A0A2M8KWE8_9BACT|nr:MAG: hypothetical protein COU90_03550 [Candidatus Ryanbacteria bacterium CG10_big_fil_rev_8_21_14_0_10_43_42]
MKKVPTIHITHSRLLQPIFTEYWRVRKSDAAWQPLSDEEITNRVAFFKERWQSVERHVLEELCNILSLHFSENTISAYVVSGYKGGFSDPLVISAHVPDEMILNLLIHELIHRLLAYNTKDIPINTILEKMFSHVENKKVRLHVIIHAALQYIFLDTLKNETLLQTDLGACKDRIVYKEAWDIVLEKGYLNLLEEFKTHY